MSNREGSTQAHDEYTQSPTKPATLANASNQNRSKRRATRACDRCKQKRIRCTGKHPCAHCNAVSENCQFNAKYTRGKAPPIESASNQEQSRYLAALGWQPGSSSARRKFGDQSSSEGGSPEPVEQPRESPVVVEIEVESDTNGASIFRRTQRGLNRFNRAIRAVSQQTPVAAFGDPPIPDADHSFLVLPPPEVGKDLVAKYFEVAAPIIQILHHPTVDKWLQDLSRTFTGNRTLESSKRAIVLLVLASAYNFTEGSSDEDDSNLSFRYFQAADHLLKNETGKITLHSIQARLIQCFYLLSRSRINQAWSIFGTVVNQIYAIDLHRKPKSERAASEDWIHTECSRRTFWTAYTLDKYMSLNLGRPQQFQYEDIDQDLPQMVNDEHLTATNYMITREPLHSTIKGTVCQHHLSIILGGIMKDLYSVHPPSFEDRLTLSKKHQEALEEVGYKFMSFMDLDTSNARVLFTRQVLIIKLSYAHIRIILFRPFLLDTPEPGLSPELLEKYEEKIGECLKAALCVTGYVDKAYRNDKFFDSAWFTHLCGYTAVVALYVYVIKRHTQPNATWTPLLLAGEKCQSQIKIGAEKESFSQKCCAVLEELHAEAMNHIRRKERRNRGGDDGREVREERRERRNEQVMYSEAFNSVPVRSEVGREVLRMPEFQYGEEWQNESFDQTAPGGGILGSLDWIQVQGPTSVVDQIERWGFSSLTGWT